MRACANHRKIQNLVWIKVLTVCWLRFINYCCFLAPKGVSTSKILSPGSGVHSVRQKDLWSDRSSAQTGEEAEVIMADSLFKDGINVCQRQNSLSSRGRGELQSAVIYAGVVCRRSDNIEISFQLLSYREPAVLGCVPASMPPAVWRRAAVLLWQMSTSR